jgi:energy-coupling factor transporter ATP-binding protein EcfA2
MDHLSIKVKNYKCFGDEAQGFDKICPVNLIIGRNNSGKSSLLELIEYVVTETTGLFSLGHRGHIPEIIVSQELEERELKLVFRENSSGGPIGGNHWAYGEKWIGKIITYKIAQNKSHTFINLDPPFSHPQPEADQQNIASRMPNLLEGKTFKRLRSDRDIRVENAKGNSNVADNGDGATRIIQNFISLATLSSDLVEVTLLEALNDIFYPDTQFTRISIQQIPDTDEWEIYLYEKPTTLELKDLRIPLSQTGSGFKTILLALIFIYLLPAVEHTNIANYIFAFEELENNLHPALQRNLLRFLRDFAIENNCIFFFTTHSNVIIDLFSHDANAQILHVIHEDDRSIVKSVQTYTENKDILDDLDVRASDLLQSNCVIWVEGPSDRIYINRWIQIWSDNSLREGIHYQCMFYGGRLLSNLSAKAPDENFDDEFVSILRLNKNAVILIDSDKNTEDDEINDTKKRIVKEISSLGGYAWVTIGKEIENYIPTEIIAGHFGKKLLKQFGNLDDITIFLNKHLGEGKGTWVNGHKKEGDNSVIFSRFVTLIPLILTRIILLHCASLLIGLRRYPNPLSFISYRAANSAPIFPGGKPFW